MKLSPHEAAHVAVTSFTGVPATDATTGLPNILLATAIIFAESDGETDTIAMSSDPASENYGQCDHGLYQISGRWNSARGLQMQVSEAVVVERPDTPKGFEVDMPRLSAARDKAEPRLIGMGDWRDPYDNGRMARAIADEWWRKENAPAYMAEKRAKDPQWQPSMWRAWAVYNSGSAWKPNVPAAPATPTRNRNLDRARHGLTAPMPAPRAVFRRGPGAVPADAAVLEVRDHVLELGGGLDAVADQVGALTSAVTALRRHFTDI